MKKILSTIHFILAIGILTTAAQCCKNPSATCNGNKAETAQSQTVTEVKAYYFHGTRRCATCQAVETVTVEALKEYYGDKVSFVSINRETEKDNPMIEQYQIAGQTLLIIKGDKSVDLIN